MMITCIISVFQLHPIHHFSFIYPKNISGLLIQIPEDKKIIPGSDQVNLIELPFLLALRIILQKSETLTHI